MDQVKIITLTEAELDAKIEKTVEITTRRVLELVKGEKDPEEWVKIEDIAAEYKYCVRTLTERINSRAIERRKVNGKLGIQRKHIPEVLKKAS